MVEHPLGKGEVVSSILTGSTSKAGDGTAAVAERCWGAMDPSNEPYFPYPSDPARRLGFIGSDIISAGVIILIPTAILKV